ncbi:uncharacterized protein BP01DRAFT_371255 [Aspergillus saccharolyticus JOP 1030-1]|uniref:Mitochondrial outer membrane transport complex Sam37/metaxin N-terminal domain-containing protein n=1 Tax=Aspergillus saccharolyticus JOP 1030-1 TaxID=1450539 RepID=A0A318ZR76_9EURO|nr:hypothetical protein BP01DRAFT_371255 [Aspergillus saccharolyticus JOP 1030-1]PYH49084.1 hypothetical protein BP01DRAFT_371255 [Aspergillus saccharolyticus JOP 1030-1]
MVLKLHVWGPAFSLPSIDAQCLATIAYLSLTLPKDAWVLVASSDPSVSPTNELPALRNGNTWVSHFRNIVDYLRQYSSGDWDLDADLTGLDRADSIAFTSFLDTQFPPLLALSLYVTSQNYYSSVLPAYSSQILSWPSTWLIPPQHRAAAKRASDHLGLSSLDLVALEEDRKREHSAAVAAGRLPASLPLLKATTPATTSGLVPSHRFRMEAVTAAAFEPLAAMLPAHKQYLLGGDRPTSVDCLLLGYGCLAALGAEHLQEAWLGEAMRQKAPRVVEWVRDRQTAWLANDALPWRPTERPHWRTVGNTIWNTVAEATPVWRDYRVNTRMREVALAQEAELSPEERSALAKHATSYKKDVWLSVAVVVGGVAALVGYMAKVGFLSSTAWEEEYVDEEEEGEEEVVRPEIPEALNATDFLGSLSFS